MITRLLRAAIACDDPTIVLETRALYQAKQEVVLGGPLEPIGRARVERAGTDVTVVTWSRLVGEALAAAKTVAVRGHRDRGDRPALALVADFDAVAESVAKTTRIVIAHEANLTGGFGAEIAARVAASCFWDLDAPIERVALPDLRMPAAPVLHQAVFPGAEKSRPRSGASPSDQRVRAPRGPRRRDRGDNPGRGADLAEEARIEWIERRLGSSAGSLRRDAAGNLLWTWAKGRRSCS